MGYYLVFQLISLFFIYNYLEEKSKLPNNEINTYTYKSVIHNIYFKEQLLSNALEHYIIDNYHIPSSDVINTLITNNYLSDNIDINNHLTNGNHLTLSFDNNLIELCSQTTDTLTKRIYMNSSLAFLDNGESTTVNGNEICHYFKPHNKTQIILELMTLQDNINTYFINNGNYTDLNSYDTDLSITLRNEISEEIYDYNENNVTNTNLILINSEIEGIYYSVFPKIINDSSGDGWYDYNSSEIDNTYAVIYVFEKKDINNTYNYKRNIEKFSLDQSFSIENNTSNNNTLIINM